MRSHPIRSRCFTNLGSAAHVSETFMKAKIELGHPACAHTRKRSRTNVRTLAQSPNGPTTLPYGLDLILKGGAVRSAVRVRRDP